MSPHPSKVLRGHSGGMAFVAFISDDQIISASDEDKTIRRWSLSDGSNKVVKETVVCAVATSPNGRWLAMGGRDGGVRLLNLETPKPEIVVSTEKHALMVTSLSFSPDSNQLASGAHDGTMLVWSWSSTTLEKVAGPLRGHKDAVWRICYSPDGSKIASCDRETIQIWHGTEWLGVAKYEQAWSLAWSLDGYILFAGCIDGAIRFYNPNTGALHATCNGHGDTVFSIALSHNAKFIATASWDKTVRLWDAATFQQVGPNLPHDANVHSISISPDDSYLVSGSRDSNVRVWNLKTVAPDLFKDTVLAPNRAPQPNGSRHVSFLSWLKPGRHPNPSETSLNGPSTPHPRNETPEHSANSSTKSNLSKKNSFLSSFYRKHGRSDASDVSWLRSPSTQEGNHTDSSGCSLHHPLEDPPITHPPRDHSQTASSSQHHSTDHPTSPTHSRTHNSENEKASFIQDIRSNPSHDLTDCIVPEGNYPVSGGSQGDIYRGRLHINGRDMQVAIKAIKRYTAQGDDQSKRRRLRREIKLWLKLEHQNIVPLLGTTRNYGDFPAMVCPWVEHGTLTSYINRCHQDLTAQMRFGIINDVALGLQYLHSQSVVHGDISGSNVLITGSGRACIADFGLSFVEPDFDASSMALTYQVKGTIRWTAPELLDIRERPEGCRVIPTSQSDIYSFAGIMLHVLSGKMPYHYHPRDEHVILAISMGELPKRPASTPTVVLTDGQWEFMMKCWSFVPKDRPSDMDMVSFVHEQLLDAVATPTSCGDSTGRRDTW